MKKVSILLMIGLFMISCSNAPQEQQQEADSTVMEKETSNMDDNQQATTTNPDIKINPISHATFVMTWGDLTIYNDPNGGASVFEDYNSPDIVLISDIHGDHLNMETLGGLKLEGAALVVPQAVAEKLPDTYSDMLTILANGEEVSVKGISIKAIPMYNLPESEDSRHTKGRGNGYVLTNNDTKVYIAGDTEDISEMRSLEDIDIAFVPMNLPYTMSVEKAADAVIEFAPEVVYPYHYRGQGGLSDVEKFKTKVDSAGKDIEVRLVEWYSEK